MFSDSKIQWRSGLEITPSLIEHWRDDVEALQLISVAAAYGDGRTGLLPGSEYRAGGGFVEKTFEMTGFKCTALLPSGRIMSVDEDLKIDIPSLKGPSWYLCVTASPDKVHTFEKDGIPYCRPVHDLVLLPEEEVGDADVLPVKHFILSDGMLNVDEGFITASLSLSSDEKYMERVTGIAVRLEKLTGHQNMEDGDGRRTLLHLLFRIRQITSRASVKSVVSLLQELGQVVDYYVAEGIGSTLGSLPEEMLGLKDDGRRHPLQYDIARFLGWMEEYLDASVTLMDQVVLVDRTIDYELLKGEIRDEVYRRLKDEITGQVYAGLHDRLSGELSDRITETVEGMLGEKMPLMREEMGTSLHDKLYPELYDAIYQALKELLYKPEQTVEDVFQPII